MRRRLTATIIVGAMYCAAPCSAADISIKNCDGQPLAAASIAESEQRAVTVTLASSSAGAGALARLSPLSGAARESAVSNGAAEFQGVGAGSWQLCLEPRNLSIKKVTIHRPRSIGAAAAVLGAGAAGLGIVGASSSGSSGAARATGEAAQEPAAAEPPQAENNPVTQSPADEVGRPLIPEHPCLAAAQKGEANDCGVNGEQPEPQNPISPSE